MLARDGVEKLFRLFLRATKSQRETQVEGETVHRRSDVICPYCCSTIKDIDVEPTGTITLAHYPEVADLFNPNKISRGYHCRRCDRKFWVETGIHRVVFKEHYVIDKDGKTERIEKGEYVWSRDA